MKTDRLSLLIIFTSIILTAISILCKHELILLNPEVNQVIYLMGIGAYVASLYFLILVARPLEGTKNLVIYVWALILFNIAFYVFEIITEWKKLEGWISLISVPRLIITVLFAIKALKIKSKEVSFQFKLIGVAFLLTPIVRVLSIPLILFFTKREDLIPWLDILNFPEILSIAYLAVSRIRTSESEIDALEDVWNNS